MEKQIPLSRVLELLIFRNGTLTIVSSQNPNNRLEASVIALGEKQFTIEFRDNKNKDLLNEKDLIGLISYKSQLLSFPTSLQTTDETSESTNQQRYHFTMPEWGTLTNRRNNPRLSLQHANNELKAILKVSTRTDNLVIETQLFHDVSPQAIALFLPRHIGLVLPDDVVTSLVLMDGENTVLDTKGRIARIDLERFGNPKGTYLVVIQFFAHLEEVDALKGQSYTRGADRIYLLDQKGAFLEATHPLFKELKVRGYIADISSSGLSFVLEETKYPIIPGLTFHGAVLQLPLTPRYDTSFTVLYCQRSADADQAGYRIGVRFKSLSGTLHKAIHSLSQRLIHPQLVDANSEHYEELWEFFFETGFIYGEKRQHLQQMASKLFNTYLELLKGDTPILRKILFRDENELKGHVSAIKFFDNAWIIQHLNALRITNSISAAQLVIKAITSFFADTRANNLVDNQYVVFYYRPNNLYPAMVFGEASRLINNSNICSTVDLNYCLPKQGTPQISVSNTVEVRDATDDDLLRLEEVLVAQKYYSILRIEGLEASKISRLKISKHYSQLRLYRYRRVMVAIDGDHLAFAICNYASPGLNLSELTNSFRIFYTSKSSSVNEKLATALTVKVLASYEETDTPFGVLLTEEGQVIPPQFEKLKIYRYWYLDTSHIGLFQNAISQIFANIKLFLSRYKEAEKGDERAA